jgi:hypothetical protein
MSTVYVNDPLPVAAALGEFVRACHRAGLSRGEAIGAVRLLWPTVREAGRVYDGLELESYVAAG